ncbi:hypothetical protein HMPREF0043_00276 [Actinobaculum sp. oral taxon 183 str. F0552]|nr:hypothetical protein HMPREF0043_00276 [Actinobaculum sp. oral taxon 183 str. F0552]
MSRFRSRTARFSAVPQQRGVGGRGRRREAGEGERPVMMAPGER